VSIETHKEVRFFRSKKASEESEETVAPPTVTDPPVIPCIVNSLVI
jgi:hypothetical protein